MFDIPYAVVDSEPSRSEWLIGLMKRREGCRPMKVSRTASLEARQGVCFGGFCVPIIAPAAAGNLFFYWLIIFSTFRRVCELIIHLCIQFISDLKYIILNLNYVQHSLKISNSISDNLT